MLLSADLALLPLRKYVLKIYLFFFILFMSLLFLLLLLLLFACMYVYMYHLCVILQRPERRLGPVELEP